MELRYSDAADETGYVKIYSNIAEISERIEGARENV